MNSSRFDQFIRHSHRKPARSARQNSSAKSQHPECDVGVVGVLRSVQWPINTKSRSIQWSNNTSIKIVRII
jgi:hypothetical protein